MSLYALILGCLSMSKLPSYWAILVTKCHSEISSWTSEYYSPAAKGGNLVLADVIFSTDYASLAY